MLDDKKLREETLDELRDFGQYLREKNCCVCINVYPDCNDNHPFKEEDPCKPKKEKKQGCCVCINVFADCKDKHPFKEEDPCKPKK